MKSMERWLYAAAIAAVLLGGGMARGQCGGWLAGDGVPGVDGDVYALVEWDPDGEGPATELWVVGGTFEVAGGVMARNIAAFDPVTRVWSPLSTGMSEGVIFSAVYALKVLPSGELAVGGLFGRAGGVAANNVAVWDGSQWRALGSGADGRVLALAVMANGDLVAGGMFNVAGGTTGLVARWDGSAWQAMGGGLGDSRTTARVESFAFTAEGDLLACGTLSTPPGEAFRRSVARWDGASWSTFGGPITGFGYSIATALDGQVWTVVTEYPSVRLLTSSGGPWVQRNALNAWYRAVIASSSEGELVLGGFASGRGTSQLSRVLRWTEGRWEGMGVGFNSGVRSLLSLAEGNWVAGGAFTSVDGLPASRVAHWDGDAWAPVSEGMAIVRAIAPLPEGGIVAGGDFLSVGGVPASRVAKWDGARWAPLGAGLNGPVFAVAPVASGDIVVGGEFTEAGGVVANRVARWDGVSWSSLGAGLSLPVRQLVPMLDGRVIALYGPPTGSTGHLVAVWNGSSWGPGLPAPMGTVNCMGILPDGRVVAAGLFLAQPVQEYLGCLAVLTGAGWSYFGREYVSGRTGIGARSLGFDRDGTLILGGSFLLNGTTQTQSVLRWNGASLQPVGPLITGPVTAIAAHPDGGLIVGGEFSNSQPGAIHHLARWDGVQWSEFAGGANGNVLALALHGDQELIVGGEFGSVGGVVSSSFARYSLTGFPFVASHPQAQTITDREVLTLTATPASGYEGVSVQWRRNGVAVADGPGGASIDGGTVSGAAGVLASPTDGTPAVLTIADARMSDAGTYTATFTSACGEVTTLAAAVRVDPCPADFDADGFVDGEDVIGFFAAWDASNAAADFNGDGGVDSDDVIGFFARWDAGC